MKNNYKKIILMMLTFLFIIPQIVFAQDTTSFKLLNISDDSYTFDFRIINNASYDNKDQSAFIEKKLSKYVIAGLSATKDGKKVFGEYTWENPDYIIKSGEQTVTMLFTSDEGEIVKADIYLYGVNWKNTDPDADLEDEVNNTSSTTDASIDTTPTLTATTLIMSDEATYDINVNDKIADSTYVWTSSNTKVAKVNAKTGVVTAVADGKAKVTCKITTPESETITLISNVTVGESDDYPSLNDNDIELSVSDKFDLNVEDQIAKSKYRYVSSDKTIASVNATNGIVTAKKTGTAVVRCIVTSPNGEIYVLKCDVEVTK